MKTRPIDANQLYRIEKLLDTDIVKKDKVASELLEQVLYDIQHMPTLTPQNEQIIDEIDDVTWYTLKCGEMIEGAPSPELAWYKAKNILSITDKYRRPPEGEE